MNPQEPEGAVHASFTAGIASGVSVAVRLVGTGGVTAWAKPAVSHRQCHHCNEEYAIDHLSLLVIACTSMNSAGIHPPSCDQDSGGVRERQYHKYGIWEIQ